MKGMRLADIKRGDSVFVVRHGSRGSDPIRTEWLEVSSAGPKYVTAGESYRRTKFHRDSGREVTEYTARNFAYATEDEWADERARKQLEAKASGLMRAHRLSAMTDADLVTLISLLEVPV